MKTRIFLQMIQFEFKLFFRNWINLFFLLAFPTLMIVTFGSIFGNSPVPEFGGYGTIDISVPAYAGMIVSVTGLMNLPLTLCEYREKKILKRYRATPVKPMMVILSQTGVNLLMTLVGMAFLILTATLLFDLRFSGRIIAVLLMFLLSTMSVFSIGFLIASVAPNAKAATAIANLVYFPMLFLTGATIPVDIMPNWMQELAQFLPVTHVVKGMRGAWTGVSFSEIMINIVVLIGITVVCLAISVKLFKWE